MKLSEAQQIANRLNNLESPVIAVLIRILPEDIDPIQQNDNGWDVEVSTININGE